MPQFRKIDEALAAELTRPRERPVKAELVPFVEALKGIEDGQILAIAPEEGEAYNVMARRVSSAAKYLKIRVNTEKATNGSNQMLVRIKPVES